MTATKNERLIDAENLAIVLDNFANERDWRQFHSPKNLVMALTGEVGELNDIFRWMSEADSRNAGQDPGTATKVRHELADVLMSLIRLSSVLGVDLDQAVSEKLALNELKYPVSHARGSSKKYTDF